VREPAHRREHLARKLVQHLAPLSWVARRRPTETGSQFVRIAAAHRRDRAICQLVREQVDDLIADTADLFVRQPQWIALQVAHASESIRWWSRPMVVSGDVRVRAPELADRLSSVLLVVRRRWLDELRESDPRAAADVLFQLARTLADRVQ
jgi:hypothetical protein